MCSSDLPPALPAGRVARPRPRARVPSRCLHAARKGRSDGDVGTPRGGQKHDATTAQVALAWLLERESIAAIPKSATPSHIRENYGALDVALDETDVERIDGIDREKRYVDFEAAPWNRS